MTGRLRLAGSLLVVIPVLAVATGAAQRTVTPSGGHVPAGDRALQRAARAASTNEPEAVRRFTEELVRSSPLTSTAAPSLRDRVYNTELAFRRGAHRGISEGDLIAAANAEVQTLGLPSYARVTRGQLKLVREDLQYTTRGFGGRRPDDDVMSPAEALYVASDLAVQKLANPEYQIEPEEWERTSRARRGLLVADIHKSRSMKPPKVSVTLNPPRHVHLDLADESSVSVAKAHAMLDRLGFAR
jgi:hypothetical protein